MANIIICDDEKDIVNSLRIYLEAEDYKTYSCYSGQEAINILNKEEIHLVLLDIMMPGMDGISTLAKIRETYNVPVIMLSAKSEDTDKILGLNVGADDYVTKPFNPVEVLARVKSQLRRYMKFGGTAGTPDDCILCVGNIELNDSAKEVRVDGELVDFTPTEYDILKLFLQHPGEVFAPKDIYRKVWNDLPLGAESTIAVHIRHIREKIEINPAEPRYLKVVWGKGYKLVKGGI